MELGRSNRRFRVMKSFPASAVAGLQVQVQGGGVGTAFQSPAVGAGLPHYAIQQGIPYNVYG